MKLQIALDTLLLEQCISLLEETKGLVEIAEIGTPFVIEDGMRPVKVIKEKFPEIEVLADAKIMDAGEYEADKCFQAGADIVTVLALSNDETIKGVVRSAKKYQKKVMVDMIEVKDIKKRALEVEALGVDYLCVHTAFDIQKSGKDPLDELKELREVIDQKKCAVAGGVKLSTIDEIVKQGVEIVVVGGYICNAIDKVQTTKELKEHMR